MPQPSDRPPSLRKAYLYGFLTIGMIAISFSAIFIRWSSAPVSVVGMHRLLLTVLAMTPFLYKYRRQFTALSIRDYLLLSGSGVFLALHFLLWMGSLNYTTVASSTVLLTLEPILVMLGSLWVFKEKISRGSAVSMAVAVTGAVMIGWGDLRLSGTALYGDLLSILGTLAVVVHMLLGQALRSRVPNFLYNYIVFASASLSFAIYNAAFGYSFFAYPPKEWILFALTALVPTVFGHMLFNWLLKFVGATTVSMATLGEPVGATLLAWLLLGERLGPLQAGAGALLIAGVWMFLRYIGDRHTAQTATKDDNTAALQHV
ncbi:DMT family transporter [Paenibacillus thermotolerans]|uniref:DMT family transporter n=1 Tax=Paenibacillus thermotolerans TaxID=3027807 RepID=UPI00236798F1|nr:MULTISPECIES: DMT family transporter [unclassified Paenibacillus]